MLVPTPTADHPNALSLMDWREGGRKDLSNACMHVCMRIISVTYLGMDVADVGGVDCPGVDQLLHIAFLPSI